jgi:hypothetical protein
VLVIWLPLINFFMILAETSARQLRREKMRKIHHLDWRNLPEAETGSRPSAQYHRDPILARELKVREVSAGMGMRRIGTV